MRLKDLRMRVKWRGNLAPLKYLMSLFWRCCADKWQEERCVVIGGDLEKT